MKAASPTSTKLGSTVSRNLAKDLCKHSLQTRSRPIDFSSRLKFISANVPCLPFHNHARDYFDR